MPADTGVGTGVDAGVFIGVDTGVGVGVDTVCIGVDAGAGAGADAGVGSGLVVNVANQSGERCVSPALLPCCLLRLTLWWMRRHLYALNSEGPTCIESIFVVVGKRSHCSFHCQSLIALDPGSLG